MTVYTFQDIQTSHAQHRTQFFDFTRIQFEYFRNSIFPHDLVKCNTRFEREIERDLYCRTAYDLNYADSKHFSVNPKNPIPGDTCTEHSVEKEERAWRICRIKNVRAALELLEGAVHLHYNDNTQHTAQLSYINASTSPTYFPHDWGSSSAVSNPALHMRQRQ